MVTSTDGWNRLGRKFNRLSHNSPVNYYGQVCLDRISAHTLKKKDTSPNNFDEPRLEA